MRLNEERREFLCHIQECYEKIPIYIQRLGDAYFSSFQENCIKFLKNKCAVLNVEWKKNAEEAQIYVSQLKPSLALLAPSSQSYSSNHSLLDLINKEDSRIKRSLKTLSIFRQTCYHFIYSQLKLCLLHWFQLISMTSYCIDRLIAPSDLIIPSSNSLGDEVNESMSSTANPLGNSGIRFSQSFTSNIDLSFLLCLRKTTISSSAFPLPSQLIEFQFDKATTVTTEEVAPASTAIKLPDLNRTSSVSRPTSGTIASSSKKNTNNPNTNLSSSANAVPASPACLFSMNSLSNSPSSIFLYETLDRHTRLLCERLNEEIMNKYGLMIDDDSVQRYVDFELKLRNKFLANVKQINEM